MEGNRQLKNRGIVRKENDLTDLETPLFRKEKNHHDRVGLGHGLTVIKII